MIGNTQNAFKTDTAVSFAVGWVEARETQRPQCLRFDRLLSSRSKTIDWSFLYALCALCVSAVNKEESLTVIESRYYSYSSGGKGVTALVISNS